MVQELLISCPQQGVGLKPIVQYAEAQSYDNLSWNLPSVMFSKAPNGSQLSPCGDFN